MGIGIRGGSARQLQALLEAGAVGSMDDGELLARFLRRDDSAEPAFATLVDRHGRMVLRVCLDVLGDSHEAQDAAQATFFILARKAAAIRRPDALPGWLHGTARRVASRALRDAIRRRRHERRSAEVAEEKPVADESARGWPELHEELSRLPDRYREPIVLCDLAGLTHQQAAEQLRCPPRTLQTRLYRGRERLKDRLVRRGVAPSVALVGVVWASESQAAMPPSWAASTAGTAVRLAGKAGWAAAGGASSKAIRWARNHIQELAMFKLKMVLATGLLMGLAWTLLPSTSPNARAQAGGKAPAKTGQTPAQAAPEPAQPKPYTHPITVTGRALGPDGKPLADARIYMASDRADYKRVAETTTDFEGRYEFREVPLPIERSDTVNGRDYGVFQVFGEAAGLGFAYRPLKFFYPLPKPANITYEPEHRDPPGHYESTDVIALDLKFPPSAPLAGTIVDDLSHPIPDARLEIRSCVSLIDVDNVRPGWSFDVLNQTDSAPASMKIRTTDALGRFDFQGMPVDCRFWVHIRAKGFPARSFNAATARDPQPDHDGAPVLSSGMKIILKIPLDVPIKMVYADTRMPAAKAFVQAAEGYINASETTNEQGRVTLRLPKGEYRMENWPAVGTPYLVTGDTLEVGEKPPTEPLVYSLRRAAELEVIVTDEATGRGLPGVDLWHPTEYGPRNLYFVKSWEVANRLVRRDSPRTDEQGKVKVLAEPGKQLIGVGLQAYPKGYVAVEKDGQEVECRAGETTTVKFRMRPAKQAARPKDEFDWTYTLRDDEDVKAFQGDLLEARNKRYRGKTGQIGIGAVDDRDVLSQPMTLFFRWRDNAPKWRCTIASAASLHVALATILNVAPQEIEGDAALLRTPIPADFLVRDGIPPEKLIPQLETILRADFHLPVRLSADSEARDVIVVRGRYKFQPDPDRDEEAAKADPEVIEVYAHEIAALNTYPSTTHGSDFTGFVSDLARYIGVRFVDEAEEPSKSGSTHWRISGYQFPDPAKFPAGDREPTLDHVAKQTGLTFRPESRQVRVVKLERSE